jgi:hypothetical protein
MKHTWNDEQSRIETAMRRKPPAANAGSLKTPDHQWQVAQDTGGAHYMNWCEATGPLTLAVFARRSEKVRLRICDTVRMDGLVWSLCNGG